MHGDDREINPCVATVDWYWAIGIIIQVVAFFAWCANVILGFVTLNPGFLWGAVVTLIWFVFAPWTIREYPDAMFLLDNPSAFSSLYGAIVYERRMERVRKYR